MRVSVVLTVRVPAAVPVPKPALPTVETTPASMVVVVLVHIDECPSGIFRMSVFLPPRGTGENALGAPPTLPPTPPLTLMPTALFPSESGNVSKPPSETPRI